MWPGFSGVLRWLLPVATAAILAVAGLVLLWCFLEPVAAHLAVPADKKIDIVRVYLLAVGGILLIWQVSIANRRASSAERVAELTALGNITERLNTAIEHLGNDNSIVRVGALYQLHHIAMDAPDYRRTVFELVEAHSELIDPLSDEWDTLTRMLNQRMVDGGVYYDQDAENGT